MKNLLRAAAAILVFPAVLVFTYLILRSNGPVDSYDLSADQFCKDMGIE